MQDGSVGDLRLPVSLEMANRHEMVLDSELVAEVSKSDVIKLASIVGDEHEQDIEPNNDIFLNEFSYLGFDDHSQ